MCVIYILRLFADNRSIINPWMKGELSVDDIVGQMSQDIGIASEVILGELRRSCEEMQYSIDNLEDIIKQIQARGIKVVIATDNMDTFSLFTAPAMNLNKKFDGILNSHDIGYLKDDDQPDDRILFFDQYLAKNGWRYTDAILLDGSSDKSGNYEKLGFDRVEIDSPKILKQELERLASVG